jgi:hypothetical protein
MSNEAYRKCRTCRFCSHKDDMWVCKLEVKSTVPDGTCKRYRPGCCENCTMFADGICRRTGEEKYELDVCTEYDPSGSL